MDAKPAALLAVALGMTAFLTACDNFAEYTVINETDEELLTWPLLEDCSVVVGNKQDYLHEEVIKPRDSHSYFDAYWGPDAQCVQVVTAERRLVLSEQYEYGGTYTVREPFQLVADPIPERGELPSESWGERFREIPPGFFVGMAFGFAVLAAFVFAVFITVRFFYRYYVRKG